MATQNSIGLGLVGSTGTGNFVGASSPTLVTPTIGVASATSVNFGASATSGIIGVTGGTSAAAGVVGEIIVSNVPFSNTNFISNNIATDLISISLTAGEWHIFGNVKLTNASAAISGASAWISTTSATTPDPSLINDVNALASNPFLEAVGISAPYTHLNISTTTTVYISCFVSFSSGTTTMCGNIYAIRAR